MSKETPTCRECGGATKIAEVEYGFERKCKDCGEWWYPSLEEHRKAFDDLRESTADLNMGP